MRGLLADVNLQGHLPALVRHIDDLGLLSILAELNLAFASFRDLNLPLGWDNRSLWSFCQAEGWVLFTDNRNHNGPESLEAILDELWQVGHLPILTITSKIRFERSPEFASRVADLLFDIANSRLRDQRRIFVPVD